MAQSVLVIADSGTGKSTSIRKLNPTETFIINIANKPLPLNILIELMKKVMINLLQLQQI